MWPDLNNMLQYLPGFGSVTVLALDLANFVDIYIPGISKKVSFAS